MSGWSTWPGYRVAPPRTNMCAVVLDRQVEAGFGSRPALTFDGGAWSYDALLDRVARLAGGLAGLGLARGDRVILRSRNTPEFCAAILASFRLGLVPVLVSTLLREEEIAYIAGNSGARIALGMAETAAPLRGLLSNGGLDRLVILDGPAEGAETTLEAVVAGRDALPPADTGADEPALLLYSSGTTGRPKGVLHGHRWIHAMGDVIQAQMRYGPDDIAMTPGEFSFMATWGHCLMTPLAAGAICALYAGRPSPAAVLSAIAARGVTKFMSVPTFYRTVLANGEAGQGLDLSRVRMWMSGGEMLASAAVTAWESRFGRPLYDMYGISEMQVVIGNADAYPVKPGSMGRLIPGVRLSLRDEALEEVPPGQPGRVMIHRSDPGLFLGYYQQWEKWRLAHRGDYYDTGDFMRRDEDGYYWYLGRQDDLFKSRGMFVSPGEVEDALMSHPAIAEVAVIGVPDERIGNAIHAFVVLKPGQEAGAAMEAALIDHAGGRLADYKRPAAIKFRDALPKSVVGKIVRRALAEETKTGGTP